MSILITVTHRTVEHTDPDAAGFVDGWWWTVETDHGLFESATPTKEQSEKYARGIVASHHPDVDPDDIEVVYGDELHPRRKDEARVEKLRAA